MMPETKDRILPADANRASNNRAHSSLDVKTLIEQIEAIKGQWYNAVEHGVNPDILQGTLSALQAGEEQLSVLGFESLCAICQDLIATLNDLIRARTVPNVMIQYVNRGFDSIREALSGELNEPDNNSSEESLSQASPRLLSEGKPLPSGISSTIDLTDDEADPNSASADNAPPLLANQSDLAEVVYIFDQNKLTGSQLAIELKGHGLNTLLFSEWTLLRDTLADQAPMALVLVLDAELLKADSQNDVRNYIRQYGQLGCCLVLSLEDTSEARTFAVDVEAVGYHAIPYSLPMMASQLNTIQYLRASDLQLWVLSDKNSGFQSLSTPSADWAICTIPSNEFVAHLKTADRYPDAILLDKTLSENQQLILLTQIAQDFRLVDIPLYNEYPTEKIQLGRLRALVLQKVVNVLPDLSSQNWFEQIVAQVLVSQRRRAIQQYMEQIDLVSGLPIPEVFYRKVEQRLGRLDVTKSKAALYYVRLDYFRDLVAELGLESRADSRRAFAFCILSEISALDLVTSLGDNEYLVFVQRHSNWNVESLKAKLLTSITQYARSMTVNTPLKASVGFSYLSKANLLQGINSAMASSQWQQQDAPLLVESLNASEPAEDSVSWQAPALDREQLFLVFQPIISLEDDGFQRYEALLRLDHGGEALSPAEFLLERMEPKLQRQVDRWVVEMALQTLHEQLAKHQHLKLFIKVSHYSIAEPSFADWFQQTLEDYQVPPERCVIEIKERALQTAFARVQLSVAQLREQGVSVCLADFQVNRESIARLDHLAIDYLKPAQGFVDQLNNNAQIEEVFTPLVNKVNELDISLMLGFIESPRLLTLASRRGVSLFEGFFLQPPDERLDFDFSFEI